MVSFLGDWFNLLAVLALLRDMGAVDARSFGWVLIVKTLPGLVIAPLAGSLVDRLDRRRLLIVLDLARALLVGCLIAVPAFVPEANRVAALYAIVLTHACCMAVADPCRRAFLPQLVSRRELLTANALNAAAWSTMFTLGTAAGGVVTELLGWRVALSVDVLSFLLSAGLLFSLAAPPAEEEEEGDAPESKAFVDGLRYLAARPRLWTLACAKGGWSLAGGATLVLTVLGERSLRIGATAMLAVTLLYMARGLGTGIGPIVARRLAGSDGARAERLIGWSYLWAGVMYMGVSLTDSLALACSLVLLAHLGGATVWVFSTVRLQVALPSGVRGRVFAAEQALWKTVYAASTYCFGLAIDSGVELTQVTLTLGSMLLLPGVLWALRARVLGPAER